MAMRSRTLLAQVRDLSVDLDDSLLQIGDQEVEGGGSLLSGMELVLGLGSELVECRDAAGTSTDGQGQVVGALPGLERHTPGELGKDRGIDGIGLGAGLDGLSEAFGSLGIDHHESNPASSRARAKSRW